MPDKIETMMRERTIGKFIIPDLTAEAPLTAWNQIGRKYTRRRKQEPIVNENQHADHMVRCFMILGGTVAVSCFQNCSEW